jgi:hypothetical protein
MEYNVLNNIETIKSEICEGIQMRRRNRTRCTISKKDILASSMREKDKNHLLNTLFTKDELLNI